MVSTRPPAVAGQFYSGSRESLKKEVASLVDEKADKVSAIGVLSPHAGYMYSGSVAGSVFSSIEPSGVYVILGPNHTGLGAQFALSKSAVWSTPLDEALIDCELGSAIKNNTRYITDDDIAHQFEHSIEVQLPFLQCMVRDFKFVPIAVSGASLEVYREIGRAIAKAIRDLRLLKKTVIVASSDMTHYESRSQAVKKDKMAIEAILKLDEEELIKRISSYDISMCGYAPAAIMISAVKDLGAKNARLVKYATSGDVTGDDSSVVGYAGIVVGRGNV